ncbi:Na(+)/H(+) antiporter subunit F1 [Enterococcus saccharolyticus]|uniref:Monovalent cation/H+ antiporter subunit F n=1 Tax=Enterococcus saccharolyticus subsp. saccharolyticus ATCC 43076 TaxID=1139996 RepID=S0JCK6_9ENTE|nr:Na(+)/H(+) antiporter subunit F1 [Enterococcus saccharolyticus]EOT30609.1 hypothetical protein OMQ_00313 [Enterococcus saccharolyticus subsp. saccharolyticus ATCC 43076]EOT80170.1 hypothetical protein I572_00695 [Enterococcus saccharolyticus subsp. saccharolyticus ATCC 43076]
MFQLFLYFSLIVLAGALVIFSIRIFFGPSTSDRILGLDSFGITLIGFIGIVMILQDTLAYADVILVLSILSFVGTVALSKFIERGAVFDRD